MLEISLQVEPEWADVLEAYFCEELQNHWLLFQSHKSKPTFLKGYFDSVETAQTELDQLQTHTSLPYLWDAFTQNTLQDEDWKLAYRNHLKPWNYGPLHWIPIWEKGDHVFSAEDRVVYLDSGMAFGTGSHETTRLCARALVNHWQEAGDLNQNVIDAGCGSGVLGMSASVLGYSNIYAFDRDPEAVKVTQENIRDNDLPSTIEVAHAGLEDGLKDRKAGIILANIQADVLAIYAENLVGAWEPKGGKLILSGILNGEEAMIIDQFKKQLDTFYPNQQFGFQVNPDGEWVAVIVVK